MFSTFSIQKQWVLRSLGLLTLLGLLAFTENRLHRQQCKAILVTIEAGAEGQRFLTRRDVTGFLTRMGEDPLIGQLMDELKFSKLEQRLKNVALIKDAYVSADLDGNLLVKVTQPTPIARLLGGGSGERTIGGQYISEEGKFIPLSMNYSARVAVLSGDWFNRHKTLTGSTGEALLKLLCYIRETPLWRAQIAEVEVDTLGDVTLWPQVGDYKIEFGAPESIEPKFLKIKLFYTQIAPQKGWNHYSRVSVQYRNQLVCQ